MQKYLKKSGVVSIDVHVTDVFGAGGPVFVSKIQCEGSETSFSLCSSVGPGQHSCGLVNSTGVICRRNGITNRSCYS